MKSDKNAKCSEILKLIKYMEVNRKLSVTPVIKEHLNSCKSCWNLFVKTRWIISKNETDLLELKQFLGDSFKSGCDSSWKLVEEWKEKPRKTELEINQFYNETKWYIYNLVIWKASGQRPKYVRNILSLLNKLEIRTVFDFGAGVGNDTLEFAHLGFTIEAVEINEICRRFLKWRAKNRNYDIKIYDKTPKPNKLYDLLWAMDVVEHLKKPILTLSPILRCAKYFIYDWEEDNSSGGRHPFHFQHNKSMLIEELANLGFEPFIDDNKTQRLNIFKNTNH